MIISRTPFRISFFGGGTDYPIWYKENEGSVISATINKYCFVTVRYLPPFFHYKHRIRYYLKEEVRTIEEIKHPSVKACLKFLHHDKGIEIVHHADLPAQSGLGSSSTFTVGLLNALYALRNYMPTKRELALTAIHVEQDLIKENVGSQDQTTAAFGGLNRIKFGQSEQINVQPIIMSREKMSDLQKRCLLVFTGFARTASDIAAEQIKITPKKETEMREMMVLVNKAFEILRSDGSLDDFGYLLNEQWKIKRSLTDMISNEQIDTIYKTAIDAGATGGKLLGAGGGGFMIFYVKPEWRENVNSKLSSLLQVPFWFEFTGSQIIYYSHDNNM